MASQEHSESTLHQLHEELEARVKLRTAELTQANAAFQREIAELKHREESLRSSQEHLARTEAFSLVMTAHLSLDGRWLKVPPTLCKLLGYSEAELLASKFEDSTHPEDIDGDRSALARLLQSDIKSCEREKRCVTKDQRSVWVYQNCSIVLDADNKPLHFLVYIRDITEAKRLQEKERESQKLDAIGSLASGIAHSFNNLMMTVLGHSEIMLEAMKPGDAFFASALEIRQSATRTAALTQKLSAFGRRQVLAMRSVDLNALVGGLAPVLRLLKDGVRLELNLEPALNPTKADPHHLEEAILTLARNACAAMPDGGRLSVQTANYELGTDCRDNDPAGRPTRGVLLTIADTGVGMDRTAMGRVFEPFFTEGAGVGAGLGLAAVYGYIKQINGDIEVLSEPEKGTTFRIYLPRETDEKG